MKLIPMTLSLPLVLASMTAQAQEEKCDDLADCAQKAMEASYQAKLAAQLALPRGAVIPFNLDTCPEGWQEFEDMRGRFPLGAEAGLRLKGGSATVALTPGQMPSHTHSYDTTASGGQYWDTTDNVGNKQPRFGVIGARNTEPAGAGEAHENMPPYLTLRFCERI